MKPAGSSQCLGSCAKENCVSGTKSQVLRTLVMTRQAWSGSQRLAHTTSIISWKQFCNYNLPEQF